TGTDTMQVNVSDVAPTAFANGPSDGIRGFARTFTFSASDISPIDQPAGFTYSIDWGDGTNQAVLATPGNGVGVQVDHAYSSTGLFTIRATAKDKDGGVSPTPGTHGVLINAITQEGTILKLGGTTRGDTIMVSQNANGDILVGLNSTKLAPFSGVT